MAQWKGETTHRHATIDYLKETDRRAMAFYGGEKLGQLLSAGVFGGVIVIAILAIVLHSAAVGIAAIVTGGASALWAMRRRSGGPSLDAAPVDLADGDTLEGPPAT